MHSGVTTLWHSTSDFNGRWGKRLSFEAQVNIELRSVSSHTCLLCVQSVSRAQDAADYNALKTWTTKAYFVISAEKNGKSNIIKALDHWWASHYTSSLRQHTYFLNASFVKCDVFNTLHYFYLLNCLNENSIHTSSIKLSF